MELTPSEMDIKVAGMGIIDYLRDLILLSGHTIHFDPFYRELRSQFGDKVVELVRAIDQNKK